MRAGTLLSAEVRSVTALTPSLTRIVFGGGDLARFASRGVPDEFLRIQFGPAPSGFLATRRAAADTRYYTVRRWDAARAEMTVDFVVHQGGIAGDWLRRVAPGDAVAVSKPDARYAPPADATWLLLIADLTGAPAVGRILEDRPPGLAVTAHIEVPTAADRLDLGPAVQWHVGSGAPHRPSRLDAIAATLTLPPGPGYVWVAGEATMAAAIRRDFLTRLGLARDRITAIGYWIAKDAAAA